MVSDNKIDMLAEYFTGPVVAHHSIGLSIGGVAKVRANEFFALRESLGISGYMNADEARSMIIAALAIYFF